MSAPRSSSSRRLRRKLNNSSSSDPAPTFRPNIASSLVRSIDDNVMERSGMGEVTRRDMEICDGVRFAGEDGGSGENGAGGDGSDGHLDGKPDGNPESDEDVSGSEFRIKADVIPGGKYEYLPHTADVQLHSWGVTLSEALENLAVSMFGYMTDLTKVEEAVEIQEMEIQGHDMETLIFSFLDEWLVAFHISGLMPRSVRVGEIEKIKAGKFGEEAEEVNNGNIEDKLCLKTAGRGEKFDLKKHVQGTEVKAITYSNMQVKESDGRVDVWVIIDI